MAVLDFRSWLSESLNAAGVDGDVFGDYIGGTLDTLEGDSTEEVIECVVEILEGCMEEECTRVSLGKEIEKKWMEEKERRDEVRKRDEEVVLPDEDTPVCVKDLVREAKESATPPGLSSEEKRLLVAQYDCESDGDMEESGHGGNTGGLFANYNASEVEDAQKLHRDLLKSEHDTKVERDRRNKEVQKQKLLDRKEKEKKRTQKQEKRR